MNLFLWFILPVIFAVLTLIFSFRWTRKHHCNRWNIIMICLISILNLTALIVLWEIYQDAWPSYLPHIQIAISIGLLCIQYLYNKRKISQPNG